MRFTPDKPPKSGDAKKLWDWMEEQGATPDVLWVTRAGRHERAAGRCRYIIDYQNDHYLVWSVKDTLKMRLSDAEMDRRTRDMNLA